MQKRKLGRTGHQSTVVTMGTAAFGRPDLPDAQATVESSVELFMEHGVNHIDIAPGYGQAMERMKPLLPAIRDHIFLGCKTQERNKTAAWLDIKDGLNRLGVKSYDLFQNHAVTTMAELDSITRPGGAIEALIEMRNQGKTQWLGITGHGPYAPSVLYEALNRFEYDTVMFPVSATMWRNHEYRRDAKKLIDYCNKHDVGIQCIKMIARSGWGTQDKDKSTWYDPHRNQKSIDQALWWLLSHPIHTAPSVSDVSLVPMVLDAAERFQPLTNEEQNEVVLSQQPLFPEPLLAINPAK